MSSDTITQSSDTLRAVARDTTAAGGALAQSAAALRTAVPSGAFGVLGEGVVSAANQAGAAIGGLLVVLGSLAQTSAAGVTATRTEFERIEEAAVARFGTIEGSG